MSSSNMIYWSKTSLVIFKIIYLIGFFLFTGIVISWFIDKSLWRNVDITSGFKAGIGVTNLQYSPDYMPPKAIVLGEISVAMMLWLLVRNTIFFFLGWMIIVEITRILNSIKSLDVFYFSNIQSFKKIGKVCFLIAGFAFFNFHVAEQGVNFDFTVPFMPVLFGLASYVLAGVFEQGQQLTEDKNSIV